MHTDHNWSVQCVPVTGKWWTWSWNGALVRTEANEGFCKHTDTHKHMHIHGSGVILSLRHRNDLFVDKQEDSLCAPCSTFSTTSKLSMAPHVCGYLLAKRVNQCVSVWFWTHGFTNIGWPNWLYSIIISKNIQAGKGDDMLYRPEP